MIVKKMWTTKDNNNRDFGHIMLKTTSYSGWFLFGFIPLYIKATYTSYI
jgi:hypothetical protein